MKTGERLPRFKRRPRAIRRFRVMPRDEAILRIVARHRFIRSDQIVDLLMAADPTTGGQNVLRRLQLLFHGDYLSRPLIQVEIHKAGGGSKPVAVILGNKGIALLAEKYGFRKSSADWTSKARTASRIAIEHA